MEEASGKVNPAKGSNETEGANLDDGKLPTVNLSTLGLHVGPAVALNEHTGTSRAQTPYQRATSARVSARPSAKLASAQSAPIIHHVLDQPSPQYRISVFEGCPPRRPQRVRPYSVRPSIYFVYNAR